MEHIYTIKVKRQFDPRGLYPSERRYSASTVFGLAWLHLVLAATSILLAGLALYKPTLDVNTNLFNSHREMSLVDNNVTAEDSGDVQNDDHQMSNSENNVGYSLDLVLAPVLLAAGALAAGLAAVLASRRWYVDHNITWFFLSSIASSLLALTALCMMVSWIVSASENSLNFCDYFSDGNLFGKVHLIPESDANLNNISGNSNHSWFYIIKVPVEDFKLRKIPLLGEDNNKQSRTRKVLSINILIAAAVEVLWSLLSVKIAWRGMRADYPAEESRRGPTVQVVTQIKGNNTKHLPKNTKILPPQPDLIEHHPKSNKIKKFFQSQQENGGFFLRTSQKENDLLVLDANSNAADLPRRESGAEYRERIRTFIQGSPTATATDTATATIASHTDNDRSLESTWGDTHEYPIYDQNTLDLDKIMLTFDRRKAGNRATKTSADTKQEDISNAQEDVTEPVANGEDKPSPAK